MTADQTRKQRRRELPNQIKNLLRGSRKPLDVISNLRDTIDVRLFPSLIEVLPRFQNTGYSLLPSLGLSVHRFRTDVPVMKFVSLERELAWAAALFSQRSSVLSKFVASKSQLELKLLTGSNDICEQLIDQIETDCGYSLWLLESKIAVLQAVKGLEAQKTYSLHLGSLRKDLVAYLAHLVSWRNEDTTNPAQFKKTLSERIADWGLPTPFGRYLLFRLTDEYEMDDVAFSSLLSHEASYSLIDYYETFVRLSIRYVSKESPKLRQTFAPWLSEMVKAVDDPRLVKLLAAASDGGIDLLHGCKLRMISSDEALILGRYLAAGTSLDQDLPSNSADVCLWKNAAVAGTDSAYALSEKSGLGSRIARILRSLMKKSDDFSERVLEGARLILNFAYFPAIVQFESFFWPQLSSDPNPNSETQIRGFLASPFLDPGALRFLPESERSHYSALLEEVYGKHSVINFEKWRAGVKQNDGVKEELGMSVDFQLFGEVLIEHAAQASRYEEVLNRARVLETKSNPRYRRIAQRWIVDALFALDRIEEAIDYVCHAYLSDTDLLMMLPFKRCASALDKKRRAAFATKLSTSIVLDIYDREFDSEFESQRNYAYEDFLTGHGLARPSQLKPIVSTFPTLLIVYYLRYICVPEVMQSSTAFSSSRDVDEERKAVCGILVEIDPEHSEEHEAEIREITRRLIVRTGVREVQQSKIFVDMPAIHRWADKTLKESFARYQALSGAGLDAGGAGIENAIKDLLAGTPVSEEYLRLPKNETSELLVTMVSDFLQECLANAAHGLDCYLSMRIRHGALAGQLRAPLEREAIISNREGPLDEYKSNEYWKAQLEDWPPDLLARVDDRLRSFSRDFDKFVDRIANDYIQVRSTNKPQGLFHLPLTTLVVRALASEISPKTTFDDFLDICTELFWEALGLRLKDAHSTIDRVVKPEMSQIFESLRADLRKIEKSPYLAPELDAAILNAQTKAQLALEQVKGWFGIGKSLAETDFTLEEMVAIILEYVQSLHPDFRPRLEVPVPEEFPRFSDLGKFSDIFFIVFDNIRKHSGLTEPNVKVTASLNDGVLALKITNDLAPGVHTPERESHVSQIRDTIAQGEGEYLRAVKSEGGTGLKKLRNLLRRESNPQKQPEFGFDGTTFFVRFEVPVVILKGVHDSHA